MTTHSTQTTDIKLQDMINRKDESAITLLYEQFWSPLMHFAGNFIDDTDTCQEVVQELFINLHLKRFQLNVSSSITSYLYSSLKNKIFNHLRNQSVYQRHLKGASRTHWAAINDNNVEHIIDLADLNRSIEECLQVMPEKYRQVYTLHKHYGYTLKKTSLLLKRPVDTVEKQYRRIIRLIRRHLQENELNPASSLH